MAGTVNAPATPVAAPAAIDPVDPVAMQNIKMKVENRIPLSQEEAIVYSQNPDNRVGYRNSSDMSEKLMSPKSLLTSSMSERIAAKSQKGGGPVGS